MILKRCLAGAAVLLTAACGAPPREAGPATATPARAPLPPAGMVVYRIDPDASELTLKVYRDGPMARLGHDHVIQNHRLSGWGAVAADGGTALLYLEMPVGDFLIDDPAARAQAGPGFEEAVSDAAKAGTRDHLQGATLLDSAEYPLIRLDGRAVRSGGASTASAAVEVHVAGHDSTVSLPCRLDVGPDSASASAEFALRQSALGLAPFSVMMGALQVRDEMHIRLTLVARRVDASGESARQ
jgi:hypothetical protein